MAFYIDPEFQSALAGFGDPPPMPLRGDWKGFRDLCNGFYEVAGNGKASSKNVVTRDFHLERGDGSILLRWYEPRNRTAETSSAVLYLHGGGMISASVPLYDWVVSKYVEQTGVPFLTVDYRLASDTRGGESLVQDCFAGLQWLVAHAAELSVDPERLAVMGDSAGGCLSAGVAILARDASIPLARQILLYPALDDRIVGYNEELLPMSVIAPDLLTTMWDLLLGAGHEHRPEPPSVVPARVQEKQGLAPAYIEVGDLDLLMLEALDYAGKLSAAAVPVELHVHPGVGHGFDQLMPEGQAALRALSDRYRVIRTL